MAWENVVPEITRLHKFVDLAARGLEYGMHAQRAIEQHRRVSEVLRQPDPYGTEENYQSALKRAAELQQFAREQHDVGFSYVHELVIVKLWSILENAIDDLAFERLREPDSREHDIFATFEGPLVAFAKAAPDEQSEFLLSKLKVAVKSSLQRGAGRFEAILNPLGLGGGVDSGVAKAFVDLSETRHVIVHRGGMADKQFVSRCPWATVPTGQRLEVHRRQLSWHLAAADWYVVELDSRLEGLRHGKRPIDHEQLKTDLLESVSKLSPAAA